MNEKVSSFYPTALKCENMLLARKFYKKKKNEIRRERYYVKQ